MSNYRLPPDLRADLEWYWCRADADLGVHSNMSATISRANLLSHGKTHTKLEDERTSGVRLALAAGNFDRSAAARARRDEELRLFCVLGKPKHDQPFYADLMPEHAEHWRRKLRLIHAVLARLVKSPNGLRHEHVLFMVYGDPKQALLEDELARLAKLAKSKVDANEMLSAASRGYSDVHHAEVAQRRKECDERFRVQMGAA